MIEEKIEEMWTRTKKLMEEGTLRPGHESSRVFGTWAEQGAERRDVSQAHESL
jgi:hypothetical protein